MLTYVRVKSLRHLNQESKTFWYSKKSGFGYLFLLLLIKLVLNNHRISLSYKWDYFATMFYSYHYQLRLVRIICSPHSSKNYFIRIHCFEYEIIFSPLFSFVRVALMHVTMTFPFNPNEIYFLWTMYYCVLVIHSYQTSKLQIIWTVKKKAFFTVLTHGIYLWIHDDIILHLYFKWNKLKFL